MKLFQFTLFCILNSLCCVFANAQIIYTNVNPDRYYLNGVYNLDLNNDGTNDFAIGANSDTVTVHCTACTSPSSTRRKHRYCST